MALRRPADRPRLPRGPRFPAVTTVALLAVVAGCGASGGTTGQSAGAPATSTGYYSPLQEYLSPGGGQAPGQDDFVAREKDVQELVAACMKDEGFEYIPFVYTDSSPVVLEQDPNSRDWVAQYGYGISTMDQEGPEPTPGQEDPNGAIVEAMSDAERDAYYVALYGGGMPVGVETFASGAATEKAQPEPTVAVETGSDAGGGTESAAESPAESATEEPAEEPSGDLTGEPSLEEQGCWGRAQAEVYGDMNDPGSQEEFEPLWEAFNQVYSEMESDPRITEALNAWTDCMADAGHPGLRDPWAGNEQANQRWSDLHGWSSGEFVSEEPPTTEPELPSEQELTEFRQYELDLALTDFDCKQSSGYGSVSDEVRIALEQEFLEGHRAELERYRDVINGGG